MAVDLRQRIDECLKWQGYEVIDGCISIPGWRDDANRSIQKNAKLLKLSTQQIDFLYENQQLALRHLTDGNHINVAKIKPKLIEVQAGSKWEKLFRWWCLFWWSISYERPIGRQMRFVLWDSYHKSIIGLIGLQSPILAWAPRDQYLGINKPYRELWINQSLNAQRVGALPPYNDILGSRLVASMLVSKEIRLAFQRKYRGRKTEMKKRQIPNRLLFITTTGAFGKSPIYERFSYQGQKLAHFLGYTKGFGSFHISDSVYQQMLSYLYNNKNISIARGYGTGPSRKMKLISMTMNFLDYKQGNKHQMKRGLYLFTPVKNLHQVIHEQQKPQYNNLTVEELTCFWRDRWILPRLANRQNYKTFQAEGFILRELQKIKRHGQSDSGLCHSARTTH